MKRLLLLTALSLAAASCTPAPAPANNSNAAASNSNAAASPSPAAASDADIKAQEQKVWDAIKAKNWDAFAGFLADDLVYVSEDGVHDKTSTVDLVKNIELTELSLSDWKVTMVGANAAVVTYTENSKGSFAGRPFPDKPVRHSAAWVNRAGKWVNVYHQDCYAETAQGQPSPASPSNANTASNANAASPPAPPAASPSASPAAPATPTDTEKAIWEALRRKDFDAFAGFLASEALEVEPSGVYDKAGSVEGVRKVDFARVTLSDFKEVKLDPDTALVTYLSKSPDKGWPPEGMRHSTILANRGGRWLAVHHHGTVAVNRPPVR